MQYDQTEDTICAIATPVGEGGIGIVKISGPSSLAIAGKLFRHGRPGRSFESHRLHHGWIHDPQSGHPVDEVLLGYMAAPHTYTREDVVEINCHSGFAVLDSILSLVLTAGARLAEPGELTRRAYLNGRIDISQAEAVIDIIHSRSQQSLLMASRHLQGGLRDRILTWRESLLGLQAELEAHIDFYEEMDDDPAQWTRLADHLERDVISPLEAMLQHGESGRIVREGLSVALVGKPNVGKSSLLNALLGRDRAIVTPRPGTTRDVVEDSFLLRGVLVRILDTAGIRHQPDEIESMGIERTLRSVAESDVVLWLIDRSCPLTEEDDSVHRALASSRTVLVLNKSDLASAVNLSDVQERYVTDAPGIELSALIPSDIVRLRDLLATTFLRMPVEICQSRIMPNLRQKEGLEQAMASAIQAAGLMREGQSGELASMELGAVRRHMESVIGWNTDDDLLDHIFSRFCIGK